jgi:glycosyltransferase involved in cell wall biosynthesis
VNTAPHPFISVWVITYNHAGFIEKCLDSILAQKTVYPFEICLGEDESSDGTREICQIYAARYSNIIRLFLWDRQDPRRQGCAGTWQFNFIETFKKCRGRYIAMCDGDDFWSDHNKLQKQIDFLEQHPDCSGCFHKIGLVDENNQIIRHDMGYPPRKLEYYDLDFLLRYSNFSPMFSVVFRNHENVAPEWIKKAPFGDMIVHAGNLLRGRYGFIDEVMGYYRIHQGGLASGSSRLNNVNAALEVYRLIGENFNLLERPAYRQGIRALQISRFFERLVEPLPSEKMKKRFNATIGPKVRSIARRLLTLLY